MTFEMLAATDSKIEEVNTNDMTSQTMDEGTSLFFRVENKF
jgi:hypothetical protein